MRIVLGFAKFIAYILALVAMQSVMFVATVWLFVAFAAGRFDWFLLAFAAAGIGQIASNFCFDRVTTRVPLMT